ncbi:hypothetical protein DH09_08060 [Bacillaceae bacterium JMAK1]|nr:hypothetical protein DH09_08060 [Bacillaceae bacterium JMAK1]
MSYFDSFRKVESFTVQEFMRGDHHKSKKQRQQEEKLVALTTATAVTGGIALQPWFFSMANAAEAMPVGALGDGVKSRIVHSFDPLIDLLQNLSLPLAGVMVTVGGIFVMLGMKERGYSLLMQASIGYILLQLTPLFMDLLVSIGESI